MLKKEGLDIFSNVSKEEILSVFINHLKKEHNLSDKEVFNVLKLGDTKIPISIFNNDKLSTLENVIKYMKENLELKYVEIAELIKRDQRCIWTTYNNSKKKFPYKFLEIESEISVPVSIFVSKFAPLEALVFYLKNNYFLTYAKIGELLNRDQRTIWVTYKKAKQKNDSK